MPSVQRRANGGADSDYQRRKSFAHLVERLLHVGRAPHVGKELGREGRDGGELDFRPREQSVADGERAGIREADDVARKPLRNGHPLVGEQALRRRQRYGAAGARDLDLPICRFVKT